MSLLITNAHLISPEVDLPNSAILIKEGKIEKIFSNDQALPNAQSTYDAQGNMVMPGFIDQHIHGAHGADVTDCTPTSIETVAKAKVAEGVTTFLPTTVTMPQDAILATMQSVADYSKNPTYAKTPQVHIEGPYINENCMGAQNPAYLREPNLAEVKEANDIYPVGLISLAIEVKGAQQLISDLSEMNIVSSCAHSAATHADYTEARKRGLGQLTHFCNQMTPLHHREIGLVGSGLLDQDLLIEVICDKVHLCPDMLRLVFALKPLSSIAMITDSMAASWLPDDNYKLFGLDVIVKNNEARLASDGALAGSTLKFNDGLKNIAELTGLPLKDLVRTTSLNQALSLGLKDHGKIEVGYVADIVVLNKDFLPIATFVDGCNKL